MSAPLWLRLAFPDVAKGVRAALATLVPFLVMEQTQDLALSWTALGGWLGTLVDPGGTRRNRALTLFCFGVFGSLLVAAGEITGRSSFSAPVALAAVAFAASLLRAWGATGAVFGTMFAVLFAIGSARGGYDVTRDALYFATGALNALFLSSIIWPIRTHVPMRRALAKVFEEIAAYAAAVERCVSDGVAAEGERWALVARVHRRRCRDAIEEARTVALSLRARRQGETSLGSGLRVVLGLQDSIFLYLTSLAEQLEYHREVMAISVLDRLVLASRRFALSVVSREPPLAADAVDAAGIAQKIDDAIDALAGTLSSLENAQAGPALAAEPGPTWSAEHAFEELRDALALRSPIFLHAVRVSGATFAATIIGRALSPEHSSWVTITTLTVLQPYPGATYTRVIERVAGTVFGCVVAVALTLALPSPALLAAAMFPLSIAAVALKPRSYRLFVLFLTPVFVLLASRTPGDWHVAVARVADALAGGCVALVAALVVFPSWERTRLQEAQAKMVDALRDYAHAVSTYWRDRRSLEDVHAARRSAGIEMSQTEASLERALSEPRPDVESAATAMQNLTFARRLSGALTALTTALAEEPVPFAVALDADLFEPSKLAETLPTHLREPLERVGRYAALLRQGVERG